ncbi:unnamed protein product [Fraxinus pennsylvanica]|uniref:Retrotransposon gag domain-containing protein n=1 Tax=Fraxinus pennsylvanica TaxID=56036 RepID=A0AAD2E3R4_9LAMI|nr:unnamed protein product [Fraxinus pennsylvanica]
MEDLAFISALWPTKSMSGKKVVGVFEVDSLTVISAQLASLAYKANFHLRIDVINMFQNTLQFFGKASENPNAHISKFLDMCTTIEYPEVSNEALRLRLFPYTLRDSAKEWLDTCPPQSITTWNQLSQKFLNKYFPPKRIAKLRDDITTFQQLDSECYSDAWERYKGLLRQCPQHGLQNGFRCNTSTLV